MELEFERLGQLPEAQQSAVLRRWIAEVSLDAGAAAQAHLDAGRPIYYCEDDTPEGLVVREMPSGQRDLVKMVDGVETVIRELAATRV